MNISAPFPTNLELFIWGPIPGRPMYLSTCILPCFRKVMDTYHLPPWPQALILFQEGRMVCLNDFPKLRQRGIQYFTKFMLPEDRQKSLWQDYERGLDMLSKVQTRITVQKLPALSDNDFWNLYADFIVAYDEFWIPTAVVEMGNYGSPTLLEQALIPIVTTEEDRQRITECLTAPEAPSFYQEEEIDLAETNDLNAHQTKYFWLNNSYARATEATLEEFTERKKTVRAESRKHFEKNREAIQKRRKDIAEEFHLPSEILDLAKTMRQGIEWQDHRKKNIFINIFYQDLLVRDAARRLTISYSDALNAFHWELPEMARGHFPNVPLEERQKTVGILVDENGVTLLSKSTTLEYWNQYVQQSVSPDVKEFKGIIASSGSGFVRAPVRILLDPHAPFEQGEVLVTSMTSPEFIYAMRKASAIVTDTGGITSHAAIVSRELKIPCIVGTKIATSALKTGDIVEIDTKNGIVKRIDY